MTFEQLYSKYFKPLVYFAKNRIHDEDAAQDLVQDVFRRVWEGDKLKGMKDEQLMKVYIYQGVRNACNNWYNTLKPNTGIENAYYVDSGTDIEHDYLRMETYTWLSELISQLPTECRKVIHLYYQQGFKSGEISAMLGLHVSTVKTQLIRGVRLLRDLKNRKPVAPREKHPLYPRAITRHNAVLYHLRVIEGRKFKDIAGILGCTIRVGHTRVKSFTKACNKYINS